MKIRRYLGKNTQEAILKVKMDLGNEAVILNTRKVRQKGLMNLFAKPMVEVLAAIDDDYSSVKDRNSIKSERSGVKPVEKVQPASREYQEKPKDDEKDIKISELETKVNNMETLLQRIHDQLQAPARKTSAPVAEEKQQAYSKVLQLFYNNLLKNDVDNDIARKIIDQVNEKLGENANVNETASMLYSIISGVLGKPQPITLREDGKPTVVIFIGPTGVGKTTTLAKIAANYALNHKKNVGLITADTYRIAAVEQLKTYAEILGMPVSVTYSPGEIKDAIALHSDKDIILIDTAGRSYRNKAQFEELKSIVLASDADEIYLVLSVTTSTKSCRDIINNYSFLKNFKLIFTKIDEAPITGVILNAKYLTGKNLSYITTGQSVPDDIELANVDKLTKNLLGSIT